MTNSNKLSKDNPVLTQDNFDVKIKAISPQLIRSKNSDDLLKTIIKLQSEILDLNKRFEKFVKFSMMSFTKMHSEIKHNHHKPIIN